MSAWMQSLHREEFTMDPADHAFPSRHPTSHADRVAAIYAEHAAALRRYARTLVAADLVDDVVQEVFVAAIESGTRLRQPQALHGWLRGIARNRAADLHRRNQRRPAASLDATAVQLDTTVAALVPAPADADAVEPGDQATVRRRVDRALARLPAPERAAAELHFFLALPARAIAARLGIPRGTAKDRVARARLRLVAPLRPLARELGLSA